jgi:hypothetical protein
MSGSGRLPVPYTSILRRYRQTTALPGAERLALAERLSEDATPLAREFAESVAAFAAGYRNKARFRPVRRYPRPPRQAGIANGADLAWYTQRQRELPVENAMDLTAEYVDYELSILSTDGDARFDDAEQTTAGRALKVDLLLANAEDRTPIVGEVKRGRDKDPFTGLVQLLAYIAHLATPSQYERLRTQLPEGRFPDREPRLDGYVLLYEFGKERNTYLDDLLHASAKVAAAVMKTPEVTTRVRRLACLDLALTYQTSLSASCRWCYDA